MKCEKELRNVQFGFGNIKNYFNKQKANGYLQFKKDEKITLFTEITV